MKWPILIAPDVILMNFVIVSSFKDRQNLCNLYLPGTSAESNLLSIMVSKKPYTVIDQTEI